MYDAPDLGAHRLKRQLWFTADARSVETFPRNSNRGAAIQPMIY